MHNTMREFRQLDQLIPESWLWILAKGAARHAEQLSEAAQTSLSDLGVEFLFKGRVQAMQPGEVV